MSRTSGLFSEVVPNLQIAWDHTSLSYLKTCARKYKLAIVDGWQPKLTAAPLAFGLLMHNVLEVYDKLCHEFPDGDRDGIMRSVVKYAMNVTCLRDEAGKVIAFFQTSDSKRSRYNFVRAVVWYIDKFHGEGMKTATLPNGKPAIELSFRVELPFTSPDGTPFLYCGHIDKVGTIGGNLYVVERKHTTTTLGSYYFDRFSPNNQISGYTFGASVVLDRPVHGTIVDAMQIAEGFSRFLRAPIARSPEVLSEWLQGLGEWTKVAQLYAERNVWPMNEESCHLYGGCQFRDICKMPAGARERFLETNFQKKLWDPLSSRGEDE